MFVSWVCCVLCSYWPLRRANAAVFCVCVCVCVCVYACVSVCVCMCLCVIKKPHLEAVYNKYKYRNYIENGIGLLKQTVAVFVETDCSSVC